jgi:hypothetical protein
MSEKEQYRRQIDRLTAAGLLHGSESLCKLLRYLAQHALEQPGAPVKEYQIALEVFGRPADFNPQSDSAIRVQAGRLRAKLAEYYASEGAADPIVVELPKGSYALTFRQRNGTHAATEPHPAAPPAQPAAAVSRRWLIPFAIVSLLLLAAVAVIAYLLTAPARAPVAGGASAAPESLATLWKPFLSGDEPWVIFSNAAFIGRPETGMRYYDAARDQNERIWDHYTGVGEVLAVHALDQVFDSLHKPLRVKRGSLFSLDDASNNNLIFVGSPSENLTLADIPNTREFVFRRIPSGLRAGDLGIFNVHPATGEATYFVASPSGVPLAEDYAVVGFMPGPNPARFVMILAGTTTFGTEGAVEFVSRQDAVKTLLARLGVRPGRDIEPFEALLHVKVTRGVPVETELVAIRKRQP